MLDNYIFFNMKSFTDLFIKRPVLAIVVNLVILIAGIQAIRTVNVRQYPRSENATITVKTVYVGASADLIQRRQVRLGDRCLPALPDGFVTVHGRFPWDRAAQTAAP